MSALEWARPWGAWALLLPILALVLAQLLRRPPERFSAALSLWRGAARRSPATGARSRWRPPAAILWLALALLLGALALAGPRPRRAPGMRIFRAIVDRSPSMYLREERGAGAAMRLERAVDRASEWMNAELREADRVLWIAPAPEGAETHAGRTPPGGWTEAPLAPHPAPDWADWDLPGALWLTDAHPGSEPVRAGLVQTGGAAAPGPVGLVRGPGGAARLVWDGERVREEPAADPPDGVWIEEDLCRPIRELAGIWASDRGLGLVSEPAAAEVLRITAGVGAGEAVPAVVARDGWRLSARLAGPAAANDARAGAMRTWVAADGGSPRPAVSWCAGRVDVGLVGEGEVLGDPAAFAVSWAELFDEAALGDPLAVPLAERLAAGDPSFRPPAEPPKQGAAARRAAVPDPWLALAAALAAAVSWRLRRREG